MRRLRAWMWTAPLVLLLGLASGWLSGSGDGNAWFAELAKPAFMPPGWAFPVAWTTLYILIGVALGQVIDARRLGRRAAIALFAVQMALNLAWSPLFFATHLILPALAVIGAMIVLTGATITAFRRVRRSAALLMLPYLAWICFAFALNLAILRLNGG